MDGLFLGRFAHDPAALASVLDEARRARRLDRLAGVPAMTIGLSTYAFFWQWHDTADAAAEPRRDDRPRRADWGAELFQICDYPLIESYDR